MKIELPEISKCPDAKAHVYPIQVGFQTQEFIQASIFHQAFADIAAGQRIREPGGFASVEKEMMDTGFDKNANNQAWAILKRYQGVFEHYVRQNVLILMRSHWDWYIDKIGMFVLHSRSELGGPQLSERANNKLVKVGFSPIELQIAILERSTGLRFSLDAGSIESIKEMALVRNLGIHNRWEVNDFYLSKTQAAQHWNIGDLRIFSIEELEIWHNCLVQMSHTISFQIAERYRDASEFHHGHQE